MFDVDPERLGATTICLDSFSKATWYTLWILFFVWIFITYYKPELKENKCA